MVIKIINWIKDWLSSMRQRVVLNGYISDWADVLSGVPQGSVLGLAPFVIFKEHKCRLLKFAGDTKLFGPCSSVEEIDKIREDLVKLCSLSSEWLMLFNPLDAGRRLPTLRKLPYAARSLLTDGTVYERSGW